MVSRVPASWKVIAGGLGARDFRGPPQRALHLVLPTDFRGEGWEDGWIGGWIGGWMDGWMDRWMDDGWIDG